MDGEKYFAQMQTHGPDSIPFSMALVSAHS